MSRPMFTTLLAAALLAAGCGKKAEPPAGEQTRVAAPVPGPAPQPSPVPNDTGASDRQAAEWALASGGTVVLATGAKVTALPDLPAGPFRLEEIAFPEGHRQATDRGLENLRGLTQLRRLFVRGSPVTDAGLASLRGLTTLEELNLHATRITDAGLENLKGLVGLIHLDLGYNRRITDVGAAHLKDLTRLQKLNLYATNVGDEGLKYLEAMKELEYLELHGSRVTAAGLVHLERLTALQGLVLPGKIADPAVEALRAKLPGCTINKG